MWLHHKIEKRKKKKKNTGTDYLATKILKKFVLCFVTYSQIWLISFVDDCQCGYIKNWKTKQNKSLVPTRYLPTYLPTCYLMNDQLPGFADQLLRSIEVCKHTSSNPGADKEKYKRRMGMSVFSQDLYLKPRFETWMIASVVTSQNWTQKKALLTYLSTYLPVCLPTRFSIPWFPRLVDRYLSIQVCKCRSSNPRADKEKYKRRTGMSVFVLRPVLRSRSR